jgi:hypothetical protein
MGIRHTTALVELCTCSAQMDSAEAAKAVVRENGSNSVTGCRHRLRATNRSLIVLDEVFEAPSISFRVPVTGQRISSPGGFDQHFRPDQPGLDMHRGDLGQIDRDLVHRKPVAFTPCHDLLVNLDNGRE